MEGSNSKQQHRTQEPPDRARARSSGRSRSRGRANPSELLARRQQLLSGGSLEPAWGDSDAAVPEKLPDNEIGTFSSTEQAQQLSASSVGAKLESLSELLKNHQVNNNNNLALSAADNNLQASNSQQAYTPTPAKSIDDVYILLAKKEKDLQLAAELGKVLLEKNDELSKANERITEDYSHKLELLEQDKHKLKRQLDQLDGEYENRLIELQTDCNILKSQLDEQQQLTRKSEKEKSKLIDDLVQQNQRLTSELVEATKSEELLSSQLEQMNEHLSARMSNRHDHVAQLDTLKEEIQIVNQRKQDLERRLKLAQKDKSNLNAALDESGDKIVLLENLLNEKEAKLNELLAEVNELRDSSSWLSIELESLLSLNERLCSSLANEQQNNELRSSSPMVATATSTLPNELQLASQRKRSQLIEQLKEMRLKKRSRLRADEFRLIKGAQQQQQQRLIDSHSTGDSKLRSASNKRRSGFRGQRKNGNTSLYDEFEEHENENELDDDNCSSSGDELDDERLKVPSNDLNQCAPEELEQSLEVAGEIFAILRKFHTTLQIRRDEFLQQQQQVGKHHLYSPPNSTDDSGISASDDTVDSAAGASSRQRDPSNSNNNSDAPLMDPAPWRKLLSSLKTLIEEMPCSSCHLMIAERADYEQLQRTHAKLCDEMRRKNDEILALNVVKTEQETRLVALEERCNILSEDLKNCDKPKEEIVKLAWKARDEAVERKNNAEISLAKTRIENMQISSQLMEVVQQKGELSQKLAQFEDDIHYITQDSVKAKFTWEEYAEKLRRSHSAQNDSASSTNPLAQLLSFSSAVASSRSINSTSSTSNGIGNTTNIANSATNPNDKSSPLNNITQSASLMRNFTSNRFNLRFWQRNSSEKQVAGGAAQQRQAQPHSADKGSLLSQSNTVANEQRVS